MTFFDDVAEYGLWQELRVRWLMLDPAVRQAVVMGTLSLALVALEYLRPRPPVSVRVVG